MRRYDLDALVATSPANITYFTDYYCWLDPLFREHMMVPGAPSHLRQAYAVFPLEGEPALVVSAESAVNAADLWVRDLHIFGDRTLDDSLPPAALSDELRRFYDLLQGPNRKKTSTDALLSILKARGLTGSRIGLEMDGLAPTAAETITSRLPQAELKDCSSLIRLLRAVKTPDEIDRLTRCAAINEQAAAESMALARPGQPAGDIVQRFRAGVAALGADYDHFIFGVRGMGFASETNYRLTEDDVLEVDFGCIYRQCFSDSGTTLAVCEPTEPLLERHAALWACTSAGAEVIAPGVKASSVNKAMWDVLAAHGVTASFPHGHGLGVEVRDYPIIVADNGLRIRDDCVDEPSDLPLEANMVINLEASIEVPAVGSVHVEQSFLVTDGGRQLLVPQERSEPFMSHR